MATTAITEEPVTRRIIVREETNVGLFLDLVCKFSGCRKGAMIRRIWSAGLQEVFGVTSEEVAKATLVVPRQPRRLARMELKDLAQQLCRTPQ